MHIRDKNIIVCDGCGAEKNPEITLPTDFVKWADGVATCSNCKDTGEIIFPGEEVVEPILE